ncbi:hypothetical protein KQI63_08735 [bacterium]|nr:hypothetical protein [bacterium]
MMSDKSSDVNETPHSEPKGKPWFFIGIIGGILVGAIFSNVGAGVAIGIPFWLIMSMVEKKRMSGAKDARGEQAQGSGE